MGEAREPGSLLQSLKIKELPSTFLLVISGGYLLCASRPPRNEKFALYTHPHHLEGGKPVASDPGRGSTQSGHLIYFVQKLTKYQN